jgi:adenine-specific DNA-methyltransferase
LPLPAKLRSEELESLISEIISLKSNTKDANTSKLEKKIDQLVYKLYNLTKDEIKIIEESVR